jgi:hypothetical protein
MAGVGDALGRIAGVDSGVPVCSGRAGSVRRRAVVTAWAHGQVAPPAGLMLVQATKAA